MNMMRASNPTASMQKTYDDCYLICSTAVYFEKQNNEDEALRSWREALDQIYYHNAYKLPANYRAKTETEKALQESLRTLEVQCKERVDLLDSLRKSRQVTKPKVRTPLILSRKGSSNHVPPQTDSDLGLHLHGIGQGSIPALNYEDIPRTTQSPRPSVSNPLLAARQVTDPLRTNPVPQGNLDGRRVDSAPGLPTNPAIPSTSRSPSPDKKSSSVFKSSLRQGTKEPLKLAVSMRPRGPMVATKAASLAWPGQSSGSDSAQTTSPALTRNQSLEHTRMSEDVIRSVELVDRPRRTLSNELLAKPANQTLPNTSQPRRNDLASRGLAHDSPQSSNSPQVRPDVGGWLKSQKPHPTTPIETAKPTFPSYRSEYPASASANPGKVGGLLASRKPKSESDTKSGDGNHSSHSSPTSPRKAISVLRKAVGSGTPKAQSKQMALTSAQAVQKPTPAGNPGVPTARGPPMDGPVKRPKKSGTSQQEEPLLVDATPQRVESPSGSSTWDARVKKLMKNLPRGVDEQAAKSIFNEIVIQGDEVHWDDVAGLDIAKNALKEAVVYPFLRPDLFMGLREPARGMLLFGPPGTGKTMLARAVATESKSTFFAISASSLTSKYLGESEKLVRALFALAKALTPSIIFVDEIDSLLSARAGSSEHEATRRIKTEFLIQWSDLARAAAGKEQTEGDPSRVLVLAATNMPWAIDEAARRRFVRRQYIPLPESPVRGDQLRRLMSAQRHNLRDKDYNKLLQLTDGFSGSDITALAKDAAMGPLRALGEKLLNMSPDQIRPISLQDFEASLVNIRPSVSKQGLKEYETWAKEFGERGG